MVDEHSAEDAVEDVGEKAKKGSKELVAAKNKVQAKGSEIADKASGTLGTAFDQAWEWADQLGDRVKDRPMMALLVAIGIGFGLKMLTGKRRR